MNTQTLPVRKAEFAKLTNTKLEDIKWRSHKQADEAFEALEAKPQTTPKKGEEANTMAKGTKETKETKTAVKVADKVNAIQYAILASFIKTTMPVKELAEELIFNTENPKAGKIIHAQLGMLKKLKMVSVKGEKEKKSATILKAGQAQADMLAPEKKEVAPKKPKFTPPHSDEDIKGAKKKKAKKMEAANEVAKAAFIEEHGSVTRTQAPSANPSTYDGKSIKHGEFQKKMKGDKPSPINGGRDLWDQIVTKKLKMSKADFIAAAVEHGINKASAGRIWDNMLEIREISKETVQAKYPTVRGTKKAKKDAVEPPVQTEKPKKDKKGKKGKKSKK